MLIMPRKIESLLQEAGRTLELVVGWVCALIGGTFAALLLWLFYLVAWRNPLEDGVEGLSKTTSR